MRLTLLLLSCLFLYSCATEQRAIQNYVTDLRDTTLGVNRFMAEPVIQKNDQLSIRIFSAALDEKIDNQYNPVSGGQGGQNAAAQGYLVDQQGNVELPRVGIFHAEGLTKRQLAEAIKTRLKGVLQDPSVIIRFTNFRVIVMGEVGAPGVKVVPMENLTVLEALAMAGDVTAFGKKTAVRVLRENNGQRRLGLIDLTSAKMFESPYYQLQQNDVILVEASRYKARNAEQQRIIQQIGFALAIITSIAVVYNIFSR